MDRRQHTRIGAAFVLCLGSLALVGAPVSAKHGNDTAIVRSGDCSARSDWKIKLSHEDGAIEVEAEVDTPKSGTTWHVKLRHDGNVFVDTHKTTNASSGSFHIQRTKPNHVGTDTFTLRASGPNGETCVGTASI